MSRAPRQIPDDFAARAMKETILSLRLHYSVSPNTVRQWIAALGLQRPDMQSMARTYDAPEDFAEFQKGKSVATLCDHYGRNKQVVRRWLASINVFRGVDRVNAGRPKKSVASKPAPSTPFRHVHPITAPLVRVQRDMSEAGLAADFLRRFGPVYRCDVRGRALSDGFFWRRGNAVMSDDELIERADWMRGKIAA